MNEPRKSVTIYTDGGCRPSNPGPGGYGVVMVFNGHRRELSGGYRLTTNNRMELTAAIRAIESLKEPCDVQLFSDSQYVVNGISKGWAKNWRSKGWKKSSGGMAENTDLWATLLDLCDGHRVSFEWVRGHSGHPENERCDELAGEAASQPNLPRDVIYER